MCQTKMEHNEDGSYTVTFDKKTETFPDCVSAVLWAEKQAEKEKAGKNEG